MNIQNAVIEFRNAHSDASNVAAKKHAESIFTDPEDVQRFLSAWFHAKVTAAEFKSDVDRIWPESKGY